MGSADFATERRDALDSICISCYVRVMAEVIATDEFLDWYESLSIKDIEAVLYSVELLAVQGTRLGFPHSSALQGTKYPFRELRVQSHGRPLRVIYAFDVVRDAVLIIGGDKTGDKRFYERLVPRAEKIWEQYVREMTEKGTKR